MVILRDTTTAEMFPVRLFVRMYSEMVLNGDKYSNDMNTNLYGDIDKLIDMIYSYKK